MYRNKRVKLIHELVQPTYRNLNQIGPSHYLTAFSKTILDSASYRVIFQDISSEPNQLVNLWVEFRREISPRVNI
jgi:hypothetical protein